MSMEKKDIERLVDYLLGSCQSIDDATNALFDCDSEMLNERDWELINDQIFCCENCGWWYEIGEICEDNLKTKRENKAIIQAAAIILLLLFTFVKIIVN